MHNKFMACFSTERVREELELPRTGGDGTVTYKIHSETEPGWVEIVDAGEAVEEVAAELTTAFEACFKENRQFVNFGIPDTDINFGYINQQEMSGDEGSSDRKVLYNMPQTTEEEQHKLYDFLVSELGHELSSPSKPEDVGSKIFITTELRQPVSDDYDYRADVDLMLYLLHKFKTAPLPEVTVTESPA